MVRYWREAQKALPYATPGEIGEYIRDKFGVDRSTSFWNKWFVDRGGYIETPNGNHIQIRRPRSRSRARKPVKELPEDRTTVTRRIEACMFNGFVLFGVLFLYWMLNSKN